MWMKKITKINKRFHLKMRPCFIRFISLFHRKKKTSIIIDTIALEKTHGIRSSSLTIIYLFCKTSSKKMVWSKAKPRDTSPNLSCHWMLMWWRWWRQKKTDPIHTHQQIDWCHDVCVCMFACVVSILSLAFARICSTIISRMLISTQTYSSGTVCSGNNVLER